MNRLNRYRKGYLWELEVKKRWETQGWTVFRCAGSKPVDLIALQAQCLPRLIECKTGRPPSKNRQEQLRKFYEDLGFVYILEVKGDFD